MELRGGADPHGVHVGVVDHLLVRACVGCEIGGGARGWIADPTLSFNRSPGQPSHQMDPRNPSKQTARTFIASSVYSGRLNLAAASLALATVGFEMMIGLASGLVGGDAGGALDCGTCEIDDGSIELTDKRRGAASAQLQSRPAQPSPANLPPTRPSNPPHVRTYQPASASRWTMPMRPAPITPTPTCFMAMRRVRTAREVAAGARAWAGAATDGSWLRGAPTSLVAGTTKAEAEEARTAPSRVRSRARCMAAAATLCAKLWDGGAGVRVWEGGKKEDEVGLRCPFLCLSCFVMID